MRSAVPLAAVALTLSALAGTARAQALLYDPEPPKGSAYLRVVNAASGAAHVEWNGTSFDLGTAQDDRIGIYRVIENVQGRAIAVAYRQVGSDAHAELSLLPGSFTTLLLRTGGAAAAVTDDTQFNQVRAKLSFYNATATCKDARLKLGADGPVIFEGLAPGTARTRAVNPVDADVIASCGTDAAKTVTLQGMEAGARYSVWYLQTPSPSAFLTRDQTQAWKR